jgi:hypothetical protein
LYGLTNEELPAGVGIANTAVSSLSNTSATFNAVLEGTQSLFNVYVYWGESDGGTNESAWANTNYIGSYTNVASNDLSFATNSLTQDTEYHYAFLAQNQLTTMWATPSMTFTTETVIANSSATDLSTTSAVLNAVLYTAESTNDVYVFWGTSDGGTAEGSWANTNFVGSYTNVASTNISFAIGGLTNSTPYYYTFRATEGSYTAWAHPSTRFYTYGLPAVQNLDATPEIGYATLRGELLSAGGAPTTVHVYWGDTDGDTNQTSWAHTNIIDGASEGTPFSTNTTSGLIFGQQYYFRCFAANSNGVAWAESTTSFLVGPRAVGAEPNLVAWWKFDEAGGTAAVDSSGSVNQHDGTLTGTGPAFQPAGGKFGGAVYLPGANEYVQAPDHNDLEFPSEESFSIAIWYKGDVNDNDDGLITKGYHDTTRNTNYWMLQTLGGNFTYDSRKTSGGTPRLQLNAGGNRADDQWHHYVVVRDSSANEMRLYLDNDPTPLIHDMGTDDNDGDWAVGVHEDPLVIGNHQNRYIKGYFDDIGIWKGEALSADDIDTIYNGGIAALNPFGVSIANRAATESHPDYSMNGTLDATQAVFDVYLYWGESDGGAAPGAWANTNFIGSYANTNGVSLAFPRSDLEPGTTYYYTFLAQNLATNMWATPSESFTTVGPEYILPFVETFENRTLGDLDGQYGWVASSTEVQGSITHLGSSKAGCITTNGSGRMSHIFVGGQTDVWTDFYTKPAFGDPLGAGALSENTTAAFFVNTNGQVVAYDGTNQTELVHTPLIDGDNWVRFTVHNDYGDQEWDLYLNGKPIGVALDFYTNTASYSRFGIMNTGTNNAYVDDINIQLSPPSFASSTVILVR